MSGFEIIVCVLLAFIAVGVLLIADAAANIRREIEAIWKRMNPPG